MNNANTRRAFTGTTLAILAVLFVAAIVLSNSLLRGARLDLTANRLYTLSEGTEKVLAEIKEPITLYFFFSDRGTKELPQIRTYAQRVRELLEEMADKAGGKITLKVIDPLPFSPEEDNATQYGLQAVPVSNAGETIFFGLVGNNSTDGRMIIPFFQMDKEQFLEYDVAKLIHGLSTSTKPAIGLISSLNMGPGFDPNTRQMNPGWAINSSMSELFDVRQLNAAQTKSIDADISTLVLVHPKEYSDDLLYAIDQFVLRGGKLMVFVDPNAELDESGNDPNNPSAAMFASKASDLPKLFKAWGVEYDPGKILLDAKQALSVQSPTGQGIRHLAIYGFRGDSMNQEDVITAQLGSVNMATAGVIRLAEGATMKLSPLIQASSESMLAEAERVKMSPDPVSLFQGFKASGQTYVVAGRLEGTAKTAFPERTGADHLAESKQPANIVIVADTDVLTDRLWVQVQNFFGQQVMNAFANNGDFAVNAVDNLTGSSALISVRSRAASSRPFTTVEALRRSAEDKFRATEQQLNERLQETERKLNELQRGKADDQALILSPEQKAELEKFQEQKVSIRKELRSVRRQLDADIENLGGKLKWLNILLVPSLVAIGAVIFVMRRRARRLAARA